MTALEIERLSIFRQPHATMRALTFFPQQHKLMGSSAQKSSGVHWCRRRVRFNEVLEKVPEKVWGQGLGGFGAEPAQVQQGSGEGPGEGSRKPWCKAKSGPTGFQRRFRRRLREGFGEGRGGFGAEPGQVQQGSAKGSGEGLGGFGAGPGQVQQGSEDGSGEGLGGFGA